jgi:hypothetical protein
MAMCGCKIHQITLAGILPGVAPNGHALVATRCNSCGELTWGWYEKQMTSDQAINSTRTAKKSWFDAISIVKDALRRATHTGEKPSEALVALSRFPGSINGQKTMPADKFQDADEQQLLEHFGLTKKWWQFWK